MPQQPTPVMMNQFTKGFKTQYTGLNFPEDTAFAAGNCIFNRIGNVERRPGINYETNFSQTTISRTNLAVSNYNWKNVGGDGQTQVQVLQVGATLYFYKSSAATIAAPVSTTLLASTVTISSFVATGGSFDATIECQFTAGNGYLFVVHPSCDPFYVVYTFGSPDTVAGKVITVQIRDFTGVPETGVPDDLRPAPPISNEHTYNLQNQGWVNAPAWSASSTTSNDTATGSHTWTVQTGLVISAAQVVSIIAGNPPGASLLLSGIVTSYNSGTGALVINVTSSPGTVTLTNWSFTSINTSLITTWFNSQKNFPSNSDVWWTFKNSSGAFDVATIPNITISGPAPKGHYILDAFNQLRFNASGVTVTGIVSLVRPKTTSWFAGRVWYAGTDAQQNAVGTAPNYTWTENIYFSQIIEREDQFGKCYQQNDPTSETLFDLLPTDGGVLKIQGMGSVYKFFPIQNGLLIFAANGIWFITGSAGIGFTANDFTVVKVSSIQSISGSSFVDVRGQPMWWNAEGIYTVEAGQGTEGINYGSSRGSVTNPGGLNVVPLSFMTIDSFYQTIPLSSKAHAKGVYDSLNWEVKWLYKTTEEASVTSRYSYDGILSLNTNTQAFSPWTLMTTSGIPFIHGAAYVQSPGGSTAPLPILKYLCSAPVSGNTKWTWAEENDTTLWKDWHSSGTDYNYTSYFITGYSIKGMAQYKIQTPYLYLYLNNTVNCSYKQQGIWDYAISGNSGKYTNLERTDITDSTANFGVVHRRHRVRGRGLTFQFKVTSVDGAPFDVIGWSINDMVNQGV